MATRSLSSSKEVAETCHKIPRLLSYRVRCGKAGCHCLQGERHGPYWFLRWRDEWGMHRRRYVRPADLEAVRTVLDARKSTQWRARREAQEAHEWLQETAHLLRRLLREMEAES